MPWWACCRDAARPFYLVLHKHRCYPRRINQETAEWQAPPPTNWAGFCFCLLKRARQCEFALPKPLRRFWPDCPQGPQTASAVCGHKGHPAMSLKMGHIYSIFRGFTDVLKMFRRCLHILFL